MTELMAGDVYRKPETQTHISIEAINDRIEYREVIGWNFGWPILGERHSTSYAQFRRDGWQFVEVVD